MAISPPNDQLYEAYSKTGLFLFWIDTLLQKGTLLQQFV